MTQVVPIPQANSPVHRDGSQPTDQLCLQEDSAVTARSFELKIDWLLLAFSIQCLLGAAWPTILSETEAIERSNRG